MDPMEVAQYPCKTEPQGSQLLNQKCRIEESKIVVKNTSHTNSCLTMKDNIYSDKDPKYLGKLTAKQKVATRKNSKLVTDDVNHCLMYPKNDSSRLQVNYPDSSYNAKRYANKQHIDMTRIPATSDKDQSDLFSELPEVDHPVETIYRSDHENMKKRADISDMGYPKHHYSRTAEDRHKVSCCTSRHPCLSETSNAKKNHLKNLFIPSKKLLRNMGSNFNSQQNFGKFPDMQQSSRYLKIHRCRPEEVRSGARCQLSQVEPVVHRILIMSKKEKEAMTLPQKKVTTRKSGLAESIHTSHFFVNPVCANGVTGSNRIKQPEIMIPRCETPSSHNISRDNRKNMNVSIPYERDTLIASHPSYSLSSNKPRKAFRRFIW
uniref:DUF4005 domain-containing protein n=1 Tax=Setaria digitata TaxID=48799 RepID=A0A915PTT2_9BILA